jgi:plasmid stabilization system protein ParE
VDYDLTTEAKSGLNDILEYLDGEFGQDFGDSYYVDFEHILYLATIFPMSYPIASDSRGIRKLVFRKRTTIYYRITDLIEILAIIDNQRDFDSSNIK